LFYYFFWQFFLTFDAYTTACDAWVKVTHEHPYFFEYSVFSSAPVFVRYRWRASSSPASAARVVGRGGSFDLLERSESAIHINVVYFVRTS